MIRKRAVTVLPNIHPTCMNMCAKSGKSGPKLAEFDETLARRRRPRGGFAQHLAGIGLSLAFGRESAPPAPFHANFVFANRSSRRPLPGRCGTASVPDLGPTLGVCEDRLGVLRRIKCAYAKMIDDRELDTVTGNPHRNENKGDLELRAFYPLPECSPAMATRRQASVRTVASNIYAELDRIWADFGQTCVRANLAGLDQVLPKFDHNRPMSVRLRPISGHVRKYLAEFDLIEADLGQNWSDFSQI